MYITESTCIYHKQTSGFKCMCGSARRGSVRQCGSAAMSGSAAVCGSVQQCGGCYATHITVYYYQ
jgi:hypothetical protein